MFGHMLFAVLSTLVCMGVILGLTTHHFDTRSARETRKIALTGISLVAAWSWEHCFNMAFDVIGENYQVGHGGILPKAALAILIPAAIFHVYLYHIKPKVIEHEEHVHHAKLQCAISRSKTAGWGKLVEDDDDDELDSDETGGEAEHGVQH